MHISYGVADKSMHKD